MIWLLRGRPVIALTAAEAVMRCHSGATLRYCRQKGHTHTPGLVGDGVNNVWAEKDRALADGEGA
jgi:hypothetical protein